MDSSAVVAILKEEPEEDEFRRQIADAPARLSAASYLEVGIVMDKPRDPATTRAVDDFMLRSGITIEPVTERQARIAREAYRDYGRGSGHRASLNFGDCFAYALARDLNEPLLFKGDDFRHTDIKPAIP